MGASRMGSYKHPVGENNSPRDCSKTVWKWSFKKTFSRLAMKFSLHVRVLLSKSCVNMIIFQYFNALDRSGSPLTLQWAHSCVFIPVNGSRIFISFFCSLFFKCAEKQVRRCTKTLTLCVCLMQNQLMWELELGVNYMFIYLARYFFVNIMQCIVFL